jgi:antitoxin YefM
MFEQAPERKSVSEFASDSAKFIRNVHLTKKPLMLTEDGENSAVIVDSAVYSLMAEKLQMLEDIYTAQEELRDGKGIGNDEAKKQILSRYGG